MKLRLALLALSVWCPTSADAANPPREWTSSDGKSKFQGDLIEFSDKEVKIRRRSDFNQFRLPLDRLSPEDQQYIHSLLREKRRDAGLKEGAYAQKVTGKFVKGVSKQGLNFQLWGNPKLDGTKRYPIVIWLHGSGQSGSDNESQLGGAPKIWTSEDNQAQRPCFLLAPQCPSADIGWKNQVADNLLALIADLADHLPIDETRIYLTGSSMGGFGTFSIAAKFPQVFAACVPLCGGGDTKNSDILKKIPFWVFHGDKDDMVPVERSRAIVEAVKQAGGELMKYTELEGAGHGITGIVYPRTDLHEWLFGQRKESAATN
ncbi:prolyl oligopeptidase family serine peptidase [Prosthecobacter sp.]|uniref:carboxylesterase family protein n=1 Tax=Prosthecobacter sp. TaxID=1965333 RepID=UPI001D636120|nr:prolyl oligopeptidase family serine peptidase [Prosthecobacter sp.]MCB1275919.1 prolyl oligopeptidase family serine peptidase [Prosthecobacter sp.]